MTAAPGHHMHSTGNFLAIMIGSSSGAAVAMEEEVWRCWLAGPKLVSLTKAVRGSNDGPSVRMDWTCNGRSFAIVSWALRHAPWGFGRVSVLVGDNNRSVLIGKSIHSVV